VCKTLKRDEGFDRDFQNNIKAGLSFNININTFKDSYVNTSGRKCWKTMFDPDNKDDAYMDLKQSSKDEYPNELESNMDCMLKMIVI
jgi:hypothetical protein